MFVAMANEWRHTMVVARIGEEVGMHSCVCVLRITNHGATAVIGYEEVVDQIEMADRAVELSYVHNTPLLVSTYYGGKLALEFIYDAIHRRHRATGEIWVPPIRPF